MDDMERALTDIIAAATATATVIAAADGSKPSRRRRCRCRCTDSDITQRLGSKPREGAVLLLLLDDDLNTEEQVRCCCCLRAEGAVWVLVIYSTAFILWSWFIIIIIIRLIDMTERQLTAAERVKQLLLD